MEAEGRVGWLQSLVFLLFPQEFPLDSKPLRFLYFEKLLGQPQDVGVCLVSSQEMNMLI